MLWLMGIRQMQMRREQEAVKTFERVVEMSRDAGLVSVERTTLNDLARLYKKLGRGEEAEHLLIRSKEIGSWVENMPAEVRAPSKPPVIPAQWIDFPSAPLGADYRDVDGVRKAVLVNRSLKEISSVFVGCVEEHEGKARVVSDLVGESWSHAGVGPGSYFKNLLAALDGPMNQWTDKKMGCEGAAKLSVTTVVYTDNTSWKAEGTDWPNK